MLGGKLRISALCLAIAATLPQGARAMDLVEAFRDALRIDPTVASSRMNLDAIRHRVPQARAGLLPTLTAGGNYYWAEGSINSPLLGSQSYQPYAYTVQLTQPLVRLQNYQAFEQSKLQVAAAEHAYLQAQLDLAVRVAQAYFDVLGAQDNLETLRAQQRAILEQLASAKRNFEVGTATITDQQEAQARADLTQSQEHAAANDLGVKRALLAQIIGRPAPALNVLRTGITLLAPQPAREQDWVEGAGRNNLAVQQADVAVEIANRDISRRRMGHLPTLDAIGSYSSSKSAFFTMIGAVVTISQVGVQLNVPLYQGGAVDAQVTEGIALRDKAQFDKDTARRTAEQTARAAFMGVNSGLAQVQALEAGERSSQLALESNQLGYQVGVRINIDVLNAQQQLYSTRRDLAKARYDVLLNGLRLKAAAATLREEDLQAIGGLLEPAR